jgi:hypothetical protein
MLSKILAAVLVGLFILKFVYRPRLTELRVRFDRFINLLLVAFIISYVLQFIVRYVL